jgi:hypothetical protein
MLRSLLLRAVGTLVVVVCLPTIASAAQIKLLFEATVVSSDDFSQTNLPFSLEVGDVIEGEIVFESADDIPIVFGVGPEIRQASQFLRFNGFEVFNAYNNGNPTPVADLNNPFAEPVSGISLGWFPTTNVFPAFSGTYMSNSSLSLAGADGVIETIDDAVDFSNWNDLTTERLLRLTFGFPDTVSVTATVGQITVVPEPTSLVLAVLFIGIARHVHASKSKSQGATTN